MRSREFISGVEPHDRLNPLIWEKDHLNPEVRNALLRIADKFYKFLDLDTEVRDIIVTGSQAGYTYTGHSDLDLHIIVDYDSITCDQPVEELLNTKRKLWKMEHDIQIHGIPVEVYAEDLHDPVTGASYSLESDSWINRPEKPKGSVPDVKSIVAAWTKVIDAAIKSKSSDQLTRVKKMLKAWRQAGLDRGGEMDPANVAFKSLRNAGTISKLMKAANDQMDQDLSLPD